MFNHRSAARLIVTVLTLGALLGPAACASNRDAKEGSGIPPPADVAAPGVDATETESGLKTRVVRVSEGKSEEAPTDLDMVVVHYAGWTPNGNLFDASKKRGQPARFPVADMIPGFREGLKLMRVGEVRRMWVPANLAYGDDPQNGAPGGPLVFDVELLEIDMAMRPPSDLVPPPDSEQTESGLRYRVLREGTGTTRPDEKARVRVHYTGWNREGDIFDSSIKRGEPAEFVLGRVIEGWTEGVQLMREGEKTRFWIPARLAYGENPQQPGAPRGDLVFDVELIKIVQMSKPEQ